MIQIESRLFVFGLVFESYPDIRNLFPQEQKTKNKTNKTKQKKQKKL